MKLSSIALISSLLLATPTLADDESRIITVDGSATVSVAPDRATLQMAAESRHVQLDEAREQVGRVVRQFLDLAEERDIKDNDIQTSGLSVRPEYRWNQEEGRQILLGYVVRRDITVNLLDLDELGTLMEGAVDAGINQVQPPVFGHSDEKALRRQALALATEDARANARQIAETLGVSLGDVRRVMSSAQSAPPPILRQMAMSVASESAAETYNNGQISLKAAVSAEFDLLTDED